MGDDERLGMSVGEALRGRRPEPDVAFEARITAAARTRLGRRSGLGPTLAVAIAVVGVAVLWVTRRGPIDEVTGSVRAGAGAAAGGAGPALPVRSAERS